MIVRSTILALAFIASTAAAQTKTAATKAPTKASYKKDVPDSLAKQAKITEDAAATTALSKAPNGKIQSVELEREDGKLLYSYDIKIAGKSGIEEVRVNAVTGKLVGEVEHESPAAEKKEAAADAKERKATTKTKKPPHP